MASFKVFFTVNNVKATAEVVAKNPDEARAAVRAKFNAVQIQKVKVLRGKKGKT